MCAKIHLMNWDDLRIFLAICRTGSLGAAARSLHVHRSTVLRRIERLEQKLGNRLFDRTPDGLTLTAVGERLMPHAEKMADATDAVLHATDTDHGRPIGNIRVAATLNLAFGLLPPVIAHFREAYPEISIDVTGTSDGFSPIHPDQFDIAFRTLETDTQAHETMVGKPLGKLPLAIYGAQSYFTHRPVPTAARDLAGHRLLTGSLPLANIAAMRWFAKQAGGTEPVYRASSMLLLLAAVRQGLGIACLPRYLGEGEPELRRVFDLAPEYCADLWILRHAHHRDNARMRAFAEFMSAELSKRL